MTTANTHTKLKEKVGKLLFPHHTNFTKVKATRFLADACKIYLPSFTSVEQTGNRNCPSYVVKVWFIPSCCASSSNEGF